MNKELFASMREQMVPSEAARTALEEKLAAPRKKRIPVGRYAALAACAAVIIAAPAVRNFIRDSREIAVDIGPDSVAEVTKPHSYAAATVPAEDSGLGDNLGVEENTSTGTAAGESGDQDQDMTPGELADNMLEAGFTREDVDAYLASGWQMTWAKWWKFCHLSEESGDRSLAALLDFSRTEGLAVNAGEAPEVPGGAYVDGVPDQGGAVMAYQNLMARFEADYGPDRYPEWYGGAYIENGTDCLVVNIAEYAYYGSDINALYAQIEDWAGSGSVSFRSGGCRSLNYLRSLQIQVSDAMEALGLDFGCGIDEEAGQVTLTLYQYSAEALWKLAELDPADTAIDVCVHDWQSLGLTEEPAVSYAVPSAVDNAIANEDDAIAYEPQG